MKRDLFLQDTASVHARIKAALFLCVGAAGAALRKALFGSPPVNVNGSFAAAEWTRSQGLYQRCLRLKRGIRAKTVDPNKSTVCCYTKTIR